MRVYTFASNRDPQERPLTEATPREIHAMLKAIAAGRSVFTSPDDPSLQDFAEQARVVLFAKQLGAL